MSRSTIDHVNAICLGWALALLGIGLNLFYGHPVGTMAGVASMGMAHLIAGEMAFASGVPRRWLLALYWAMDAACVVPHGIWIAVALCFCPGPDHSRASSTAEGRGGKKGA